MTDQEEEQEQERGVFGLLRIKDGETYDVLLCLRAEEAGVPTQVLAVQPQPLPSLPCHIMMFYGVFPMKSLASA